MTTKLHPSERRILDIVSSEGPIEARRVAELYGAKQDHVTLRLRILRDRGLVVPTSRGRGATWAISEVGRRIQVERAQASADAIAKQQARNDREIDEWANQGKGGVVVEQEAWAFTGRILPQKPFSVFTVAAS